MTAEPVERRAGLPRTPADVVDYLRSPDGAKFLKYSAASVVSVVVSEVSLAIFDGLLRWGPIASSTMATAIATVPSYHLNRKWAWGKEGKGHLWRELVPFWVLAFIGWGFSTLAVDAASSYTRHHHFSHPVHTLIVETVYLGAFGVLWIGKFVIFNKVLFVHSHEHADAPHAAAGVLD
ncbi:MAG TPA: GtrA family protein [Acidimicrobiales bacterium]|nr:GtrA family protein [Acidimicrobiales bacterium]